MDWKLEDLNSRIRCLMSCEIKLPDDILLYSFIVKYAQDKNLYINDKKIIYMLKRLDRNFESVINVIDKLDIYTLETIFTDFIKVTWIFMKKGLGPYRKKAQALFNKARAL